MADPKNPTIESLKSLAELGEMSGPWGLYNRLIAAIPDGVAVKDYALGLHWSYLEAECGAGVSYTVSGGAKPCCSGDLRGLPLKRVAALAKSWNFAEATLGIAAINAWYGQRSLLEGLGATFEPEETADDLPCASRSADAHESMTPGERTRKVTDAFAIYEPIIKGFERNDRKARVVVVGHFPHLGEMRSYADLTILERNCKSPLDTPDPACEYLIPEADFAFFTGVTLINKTAPRLLALASNAKTVMVGPSVVASSIFYDYGVSMMAGRTVADPEGARFAVTTGERFGRSLQSFCVRRKNANTQ